MKYFLLPLMAATAFAAEPFVQTVKLSGSESDQERLQIAAKIVPAPRQLEYHQEEFIGFIHFGPNTFTGKEWGDGMEDAKVFAPADVDTDQWCRIMKDAGMTKVIITVKHHDGYCTWQTKYNDQFSVHQSPWKDGKGDVLRLLVDSCEKVGLKVGVYLSPADLFQMESNEGLYGNESRAQASVIPTDPKSLRTRPLTKGKAPEGAPEFRYEVDDYNRYFMNQLYELLTEYGPIHEVWFDGAHPKRKGDQSYRKDLWFSMIRKLAPDAVIFGGPDVRWCGNEHGGTRANEWNVIPVDDLALSGLDRPDAEIGTDARLLEKSYSVYGENHPVNYLNYMVSEVDVSIRRGWFWRNEHEQGVRTAEDVFDMYERTVGGNAVFLLNVPPASDGKISPRDAAVMAEVGTRIRQTYGTDLAEGFTTTASGIDSSNLDTYWQPNGLAGEFEVVLPKTQTLNRITLQEAISQVGQRVKEHAVDAWIDGGWSEVSQAGVIGYKRTHRFDPVTTDRIRVRILDSRQEPAAIATFAAHYDQAPLGAVQIVRNADGEVSLTVMRGSEIVEADDVAIHYTLDGSEPTADSTIYREPFALRQGGEVRVRWNVDGQLGPVEITAFGLLPQGWQVTASSEHEGYAATQAIDGDPATFWHSSWAEGHPEHPISLTIELPEAQSIRGFNYLPRQDKRVPDGMIEAWKVEVSDDGETWNEAAKGEFGNLFNDPSKRTHLFAEPKTVKWFRLISLRGAQGKPYAAAAEIELLGEG